MYSTEEKRVYITRCEDYESSAVKAAVARCFDAFGIGAGLEGKRVLLKPNLLSAVPPARAATTHPAVVTAAAELCFEAGAKAVVIADSPGGPFNESALAKAYSATGMKKAAEKTGAELNFDTGETERGGMALAAYLDGCDVLINLAKLKTHTFMRLTAAVKNNFGLVPGVLKANFHRKVPERDAFAELICNICDTVKPAFSIIDGVVGMEGAGPGGGDPKKAGVLIASENPFAADLAAAAVIGMDERRIPQIAASRAAGFIPEALSGLEFTGEKPEEVKTRFTPPPYMGRSGVLALLPRRAKALLNRLLEPYPIVTERCVGCGACAEGCPKQVISMRDGRAVIAYGSCIKCYCCQELCVPKAIELKGKVFLGR